MPTVQDLVDSPKDVAFLSKTNGKRLRVNNNGKVDCRGGNGKRIWWDVNGDASAVSLVSKICGDSIGYKNQPKVIVGGGNQFEIKTHGDGSVYLCTQDGSRAIAVKPNGGAKLESTDAGIHANMLFIPSLRNEGPFPLFSAATEAPTLEHGTTLRIKPAGGAKFVVFNAKGARASGGNGPFPFLNVVEHDGNTYLNCVKTKQFVFFNAGRLTTTTSGSPVTLKAVGGNSFILVDSTGNSSVRITPTGHAVVPANSSRATKLLVLPHALPGNLAGMAITELPQGGVSQKKKNRRNRAALRSKPVVEEAQSDFSDLSDICDVSDSDEDPPSFEEIINLPREERREQVMALTPQERSKFKAFAKHRAELKIQHKLQRHHNRQVMAGTHEEPADIYSVEDNLDSNPTDDVINDILDQESSDDDVDADEVAAKEEEAARLNEEMQAQMKAQMEAMQAEMAASRAAMIAERQAMLEQQAAMKKQMEEDLARMAEEAASQEAEEVPESDEDDSANEEESDGDEDESEDAKADREAASKMAEGDDIELNENTIESRVNLPEPQGTVVEKPDFDGEASIAKLRKAFKGWGVDKDAVVEVMLSGNNAQRQTLHKLYKTMYGKTLMKSLQSEVGKKSGRLVQALMMSPADYDAWSIHKAVDGLGTTDDTLIEIISTRSNKEIMELCASYKALYKKDLEDVVNKETSGSYRRLLVSLLQGGRNEDDAVDEDLAQSEAELLHKSTKGWSTDKSSLNQVIALRGSAQLRATCNKYLEIAGVDITRTLKKRLPSHLSKGMIAIVQCARNPARYFAEKIYRACKGLGVNDEMLMRIIVSRSEIDMVQIKEMYPSISGKTLAKAIESETSGHYEDLLLGLIGEFEGYKKQI